MSAAPSIVNGPGGQALAPSGGMPNLPSNSSPSQYIGPYSMDYYNNLTPTGPTKPLAVSNNKTAKKKIGAISNSVNQPSTPLAADDPSYKYNIQTGALNPNYQDPNADNSPLGKYKSDIGGINDSLDSAYASYKKTLDQINKGTIPLSSDEKALLSALQGSFDRQRAAQEIANRNYEGVVTKDQIMSGTQRYSPVFYQQQIGKAVSEGLNKITDIDNAAILKINEVKQSLFDKKYKAAKEGYDEYVSLLKDKKANISDMYEKVYQSEKDLKEYNIQIERLNMDKQKLPYEIAKLKADVFSAQMAAKQAASALSPSQQTKVTSLAGKFDSNEVVKKFNTVQEGYQFAQLLKQDPTSSDDQALLYSFAKAMDPDSVVREGEYATVQKYSQSWAQQFGFKAKRIFSNSTFLSEEARKNMIATIEKKYKTIEKQYDNTYNEYGRKISETVGVPDGQKYITNYKAAFGNSGQGDEYADFRAQLDDDEMLVVDKQGQVGAIPVSEYDPDYYDPI